MPALTSVAFEHIDELINRCVFSEEDLSVLRCKRMRLQSRMHNTGTSSTNVNLVLVQDVVLQPRTRQYERAGERQ